MRCQPMQADRAGLRRSAVVLALFVLVVSASQAPAAPLARGVSAATAQLDVIPDGDGTVTPAPLPASASACVGSAEESVHCPYDFTPGQPVTLTATANPNGAGVSFVGWSDERCPGTGPCTLVVTDGLQSITALFSPQRLLARIAGNGTVRTIDSTTPCPENANTTGQNCGDFPLFSEVTVRADRANPMDVTPKWLTDQGRCDVPGTAPDGAPTCTMSMYSVRWTSVGFEGQPPDTGIPPIVSVRFRVGKRGSGSGTVRGGAVNCGSACTDDKNFGDRTTLVADADAGSSFAGWRGACSTAPTCSLAVGPVTSLVAVFDASPSSSSSESSRQPPRPAPRFVARLRRIAVSGHGRGRKVFIRVVVNARATIRASLSKGTRRVVYHRWRVAAGSPLLRLTVPARTRRGLYRLNVSLSDGAGHTTRATRRVRLPR